MTNTTYVPNILPVNQESSSEKLSNNHLKKVFSFFFFNIFIRTHMFFIQKYLPAFR
jgi:hypothetical protein